MTEKSDYELIKELLIKRKIPIDLPDGGNGIAIQVESRNWDTEKYEAVYISFHKNETLEGFSHGETP